MPIPTIQTVEPKNIGLATNLASNQGKNFLLGIFATDERQYNNSYAIYYLFEGTPTIKAIKTLVPADGDLTFPSLTNNIPAANWFEREIADLFGLKPTNHPDLRPLVLHENFPEKFFPLRKDTAPTINEQLPKIKYPMPGISGEGVFEVPVGPIHAGIIEPGHFRFSQAGETVLQLQAKLFFTHRGIEKAVENLTVLEALPIVERICGACSVANTLSYVQAVESLMTEEAPRRAKLMRMILLELERLYNHVGDTGNICAGIGLALGISQGARLKEKLMRINERVTGNRFLRGMITVGGLNFSVTNEELDSLLMNLTSIEKDYTALVHSLYGQTEFLDRVQTTGIVTKQQAIAMTLVGVGARASGVDKDIRRDYPFACYDEMKFDVPVFSSGDVDARIRVRAAEVPESIKIIQRAINLYKETVAPEICQPLPNLKTNTLAVGYSESARGNNIHSLIVNDEQKIERLFVRSSSYANWAALTVAAPGDIIPDFPLINKSFELCYACIDR